MQFRILGPLEAHDGNRPVPIHGARRRALLAILLLHANEAVPRERLIDELWGDRPPETAPKSLQMHVSALRRALEPHSGAPRTLLTAPRGYVLNVQADDLDLTRFERLRSEGAAALADGRHERAAELLAEALALWRGPPLAEFEDIAFARAEGRRLEELRTSALEDRIRAELELGRDEDAVPELEALVAEHPLRERLRGLLMLALYRAGRQADALAEYRAAREALVEELGIEPGRELRDLERAILSQDPGLEPAVPAARTAGPAGGVFVGRRAELETLRGLLGEALGGHGRLALVSGEPGIGKSRLIEETARAARAAGALVTSGRCWEAGGAPAYWPWVQSLRSVARELGEDELRTALGTGAADVATVLPELRELVPGLPAPQATAPEHARLRVFDSIASFLRAASASRPLALVLDDMHAADIPSVLLLRYIARELPGMRVLVVAAFRDTEPSELGEAAGELLREPGTVRLALEGLDLGDVARYVELTCDLPGTEAAVAIHRRSEGNPLFVTELVRLLASEGGLDELPATVRDTISRRLAGLPDGCAEILGEASVLGRTFRLDALAGLTARDTAALADLLDPALAARLLIEAQPDPGSLRFSHALVRDGLYERLSAARRCVLHRRAGEALERLYAADPEPHFAELAYHFLAAGSTDQASKARHYARRAGDRAARLFAHEEAARLYRIAVRALELSGGGADERCELLLSLGEAQARSGDAPDARETFATAAATARDAGLPEHQARAALGYGGRYVHSPVRDDSRLIPMLEQALESLGHAESALRARVLARLAGASRYTWAIERRRDLTADAVRMARRSGDPATIGYTLAARGIAVWGPDTVTERLELGTEMIHIGHEVDDLERVHQGHCFRTYSHFERGDIAAFETELAVVDDLTERLRQAPQRWFRGGMRTTALLFQGRFDEASASMAELHEIGRSQGFAHVAAVETLQRFLLARELGSPAAAEIDRELGPLAREWDWYPALSAAHANWLWATGRLDDAKAELERLARDGFAGIPRDEEWFLAMTLLAEPCAALRSPHAAALRESLVPYAEQNAHGGIEIALGSAQRYVGLLAAACGELDEAESRLAASLAANERMGARPWAAHVREDLARLALGRGERKRGEALLAEAVECYRELGMSATEQRALGMLTPPGPAPPSSPPAAAARP